MQNHETSKEHIIEVTAALLKEHNGDTKKITSRLIADKAAIGLGSINYFFGSKENLFTECIQRTINKMLVGFTPDLTDVTREDGLSDKDRLLLWASHTFDFLFENPSIGGISILSDMQNYHADSNSVYTQRGFTFALRKAHGEETKKLLAFVLVSALQTAFLAKDITKALLGYDLYSKAERDLFLSDTVSMLFDGINHKEESAR